MVLASRHGESSLQQNLERLQTSNRCTAALADLLVFAASILTSPLVILFASLATVCWRVFLQQLLDEQLHQMGLLVHARWCRTHLMPKDLTWAVVEASSPTPMASMAGLGFSPGGGKPSVVMKGVRGR